MQLDNFDVETFLREYWQKKPLLIRNPWKAWSNPIEPDDLAGLACETDIESRLITQNNGKWHVENGPLPEERFSELGKSHWTLLVQAVDHYIPEVAALISPFRFIPNWRIDDVMVSYAANQGGVGAHFDQYDVFLVQGAGKRHWRIGEPCDANSPLLPHEDLNLLADFEATDEWILEAGDILYVPPGIAHEGTAIGDDCMTYSIGFRAPSSSELIGYWSDDLLEQLTDDERYGDADLQTQKNPGEIRPEAIERLHEMMSEKLNDRAAFTRWFGEYSSTRKYPDIDWRPKNRLSLEQVRALLIENNHLHRNPASRFSFVREQSGTLLFVDGNSLDCSGEGAVFAQQVCSGEPIRITEKQAQSDEIITVVAELINLGSLFFNGIE